MSGAALFNLYRSVLLRGWPAALLMALMVSLLLDRSLAQLPDPLSPDALEQLLDYLGSAAFWHPLLALCLLSLWPGCALVLCAHRLAGGASAPAAGALVPALRAYPAALLVALAFSVLTSVGLMLFVVPGIFLAGALQLWIVALLAGDASASQCLQHSWRRVAGHWWRSNTMVAVIVICGLFAGAVVSLVAGLAVHLLASALSLDAGASRIVGLAASVLANFVVAPAYPVALVASYRDLDPARSAARAA